MKNAECSYEWIMRGIEPSEIKFAPEGTTEEDLFGVYEGECEDTPALTAEQFKKLQGEIINFDDLY